MTRKPRDPNKEIPSNLSEFLRYDPIGGEIYWKKRPHIRSKRKIGDRAGCQSKGGYRQICFQGEIYKEHRLAWFLHSGEDPKNYTIDHINGNRSDNRICNLRKIPSEWQSLNVGGLGYSWRDDKKCFMSRGKYNGKLKNIGHSYCPLIARLLYVDYHNAQHPHMKIETLEPRNKKILGRPDLQDFERVTR